MKNLLARYGSMALSVLLGIGVWLFWLLAYPQALSFQEQYQLFLWTADYAAERLSLPGGLADWLGEFIVQFYYVEWLGALLLALLFVALQRLCIVRARWGVGCSLLPPLLLLWLMGDENVLLSLPVAVVLTLTAARLCRRLPAWCDVAVVPLLYWLLGPVALIYIMVRVWEGGWRRTWAVGWLIAVVMAAYAWLLPQWPLRSAVAGLNYYRIPMQWPSLEGYDADKWELIRQDYLIRNERWAEVVERATHHVVKTPFWSNSVNLALSQQRQLADRMFDFYQSGPDALLMPMRRDMTSNLPTAEAFWRLGMVNSAQRYMADIQESILNGRRSGRCEKRIAEAFIVNGRYELARKHLALLKKSLFYRSWATRAETFLDNEAAVRADPTWGRLRRLRYKADFLFSHAEVDKMLGLLFNENHENKMALDYFIGQLLLNGDVQTFGGALQWARQYGGYRSMPTGYQDALTCIQEQGRTIGSPYGAYAKRMFNQQRKADDEQTETAH